MLRAIVGMLFGGCGEALQGFPLSVSHCTSLEVFCASLASAADLGRRPTQNAPSDLSDISPFYITCYFMFNTVYWQ